VDAPSCAANLHQMSCYDIKVIANSIDKMDQPISLFFSSVSDTIAPYPFIGPDQQFARQALR
ncbi:MAG: hypothetical protein PVH22_09075, partial [Desulfobacteraceae bacterium]